MILLEEMQRFRIENVNVAADRHTNDTAKDEYQITNQCCSVAMHARYIVVPKQIRLEK